MAQVKNLVVNGSANILGAIYGNLIGTIGGHTVESDVPSNAVFTDTIYTLPAATGSVRGG